MKECKCVHPQPKSILFVIKITQRQIKVSENGINSYCTKCAKPILTAKIN